MDFFDPNGTGLFSTIWRNLFGPSTPTTSVNGPANFQGTGLNAAEIAAVSPDPQQAIAAYNAVPGASNATDTTKKKPDLAEALGKMGTTLGGGTNPLGAMPTATPPGGTTLQAPRPAPVNYSGTGPIGLQAMTPATSMMRIPGGALLGPASMNPFMLALLKARLGGFN